MLTDWPGVAAKIITRKMNLISGQITRHLWRLILKIVPKYRDFHPRPVFFWFVVSCSAGNLFDQTSFFSQIHLWLLKLFLMQHEHQMVNINAVFTNKLRNHAYSLAPEIQPSAMCQRICDKNTFKSIQTLQNFKRQNRHCRPSNFMVFWICFL